MVVTPEVERWLTEVHRHLGSVIWAVELVSGDPIGAQDALLTAGEETLRWLGMDPGPWPDVTDVMRAVAHSCIAYGVMAADLLSHMTDPTRRAPVDTRALDALGDRMLAEIEMLGVAGRRHGLG